MPTLNEEKKSVFLEKFEFENREKPKVNAFFEIFEPPGYWFKVKIQ